MKSEGKVRKKIGKYHIEAALSTNIHMAFIIIPLAIIDKK
jgi:hypothetical protein